MARKPAASKLTQEVTIPRLLAEIEGLKRRVAELEARTPVVIHNHPPAQPASVFMPNTGPQWVPFPGWKPGDVWCVAPVSEPMPLWNGPRNPDGSCAQLGSFALAAGNGGGSVC